MRYFKLLLILITVCSIAYSGTIDPSTPDSKYLEYGQKFECVVRLNGIYKDKNHYAASAVIIDSHHILTAAHVVENSETSEIIVNDKHYPINIIIIHKDFDKEFGLADIAIGYSEKEIVLSFYPKLYSDTDEIDQICSISGYGLTGTFNTGALRYDDKKRAGSNIIDRIEKNMLVCSPSYRNSRTYTSLEFFIGSGDSGGGLFIDGKLAGINSCVMVSNRSPNSKYGEESGHTRISKFIEWIEENKQQ